MAKTCMLLVLSNPVAGREDEYNNWYTNTHLVDVLKLPGAVAAKRFKLSDTQRGEPPYEFKYMAVYEVEKDRVKDFVEALKARSGTKEMVSSTAMDPHRLSLFFEPFAERVK